MTDEPAFPQSLASEGPFGGLTKREWFAGMALAAIIREGNPSQGVGTTFDMMAQDAFRFADAMIEEGKCKP